MDMSPPGALVESQNNLPRFATEVFLASGAFETRLWLTPVETIFRNDHTTNTAALPMKATVFEGTPEEGLAGFAIA